MFSGRCVASVRDFLFLMSCGSVCSVSCFRVDGGLSEWFRFGLVLLTQYQVIHCFSVLVSSRRMWSATAWLSVNGTRLADFLQEVVDTSQFPTFVKKFIQQLSCAAALRQINIFDETSVFVCDFPDFNFYLM